MAECPNCGSNVKQGSTRCLRCGTEIEVPNTTTSPAPDNHKNNKQQYRSEERKEQQPKVVEKVVEKVVYVEKEVEKKQSHLQKRSVGFLLFIAILILPIPFALLTIRKGHSMLSRVLSLGWAAFIVIAYLNGSAMREEATKKLEANKSAILQDVNSKIINNDYEGAATILDEYELVGDEDIDILIERVNTLLDKKSVKEEEIAQKNRSEIDGTIQSIQKFKNAVPGTYVQIASVKDEIPMKKEIVRALNVYGEFYDIYKQKTKNGWTRVLISLEGYMDQEQALNNLRDTFNEPEAYILKVK